MNIVFISNEYPTWAPGGKGTFVQTFARELVKDGHTAIVLGIGEDSKKVILEDNGVQLIRLPKPISPVARYIENFIRINKELKRIQKTTAIDIVETSELDCAYLSKNASYKKVIRLHGGHHFFAEAEKRDIDPIKGKREKKSFKNADAFIAVSNYVKTHTEKYITYGTKPLKIINNPIDTALTIPDVSVTENRVLFAGTICEKKGVFELVEAFQLVKDKYPKMHLDLYGRDWLYPNGDSFIDALKKKYSASYFENVHFHGAISRTELNIKYASALFCIFPSHMETQGLVTLEAMLLEKPVVFSQYGPGPETIQHMHTGLLCDVYDPVDIAEKMLWCIENKKAANSLGKKGRQQVMQKFEKHKIVEENTAFYKSLIN
ncbi:capsular polysaccharide biosynthesis protein [Patiriisocius marinus]|uniref:Capsular polysaccharide biosynthesis protein n=1 Tax=Patiriisocius marinus TaxID=1397112 RepID=A0A5J4J127_9FLAO|nr:glycosyltransferase family 4 protein [Patiriisocius marinus]GER59690.1 capsular polysaccharide biosynthesis protein [Patiriisocius marinus]